MAQSVSIRVNPCLIVSRRLRGQSRMAFLGFAVDTAPGHEYHTVCSVHNRGSRGRGGDLGQ
jgi:hypothetical protein